MGEGEEADDFFEKFPSSRAFKHLSHIKFTGFP